jgi:uncharacterized cupin superfamily protein
MKMTTLVSLCAAAAIGAASALAVAYTARPTDVIHGSLDDFKWVTLPEFGGKEAIIYRSPDGRRVAAAFHETGKHSFVYPFDEFLVVRSGTLTVKVHGGSTFTLKKDDVAYFREGTSVEFDFSDDFSDITFLVADHKVKWR